MIELVEISVTPDEKFLEVEKRGPDEDGYYYSDYVHFAHKRLIVIDPEGGKQPMIEHYSYEMCIRDSHISMQDVMHCYQYLILGIQYLIL